MSDFSTRKASLLLSPQQHDRIGDYLPHACLPAWQLARARGGRIPRTEREQALGLWALAWADRRRGMFTTKPEIQDLRNTKHSRLSLLQLSQLSLS